MIDYLVPILLFLLCAVALRKKENAYDLMLSGAARTVTVQVAFFLL